MSLISGGGGGSSGSGAVSSIAATVAAATLASLDFPSIPSTYTSLLLVANVKGDNPGASGLINLKINNDSTAIYDYCNTIALSSGSVTVGTAVAQTAARIGAVPGTVSTVQGTCNVEIIIPNYTATTYYKTWMGSGGRKDADAAGSLINEAPWGSYRSTTAVSRLTLLSVGLSGTAQNFLVGSSAQLYGIS